MEIGEKMREHKYRAWNDEHKKMYYSHRPDGSDNPLWSWDAVFRSEHDGEWTGNNGAIKMGYIGLKDVNITDIYEGDILRNEAIGINYVIKYIATECKFEGKGKRSFMLPTSFNKHQIVGNICENPELIK